MKRPSIILLSTLMVLMQCGSMFAAQKKVKKTLNVHFGSVEKYEIDEQGTTVKTTPKICFDSTDEPDEFGKLKYTIQYYEQRIRKAKINLELYQQKLEYALSAYHDSPALENEIKETKTSQQKAQRLIKKSQDLLNKIRAEQVQYTLLEDLPETIKYFQVQIADTQKMLFQVASYRKHKWSYGLGSLSMGLSGLCLLGLPSTLKILATSGCIMCGFNSLCLLRMSYYYHELLSKPENEATKIKALMQNSEYGLDIAQRKMKINNEYLLDFRNSEEYKRVQE